MIDLKDYKVLVTGGTYGVGEGIAGAMIRAGAHVVVSARKEPSAEVRSRFEGGGDCQFSQFDMSDGTQARACVRDAHERLGGLDCLVNNAGSLFDVPFMDLTEEHFEKTFNLNVRGYFLASLEFAHLVGERRGDASIICIGSTNGIQAEHESVLYDASKGAILMLMKSMAVSLAERGIRVNGVAPGLIRTPFVHGSFERKPQGEKLFNAQVPMGRVGEIEDCGGAAVFLASDAARYITGNMIYVDGGLSSLQAIWELPAI